MPRVGFSGAVAPFGSAVNGTRSIPFQKSPDTESTQGATGSKTMSYFNHISAMKAYETKCPEELRWEDYQVWHCHLRPPLGIACPHALLTHILSKTQDGFFASCPGWSKRPADQSSAGYGCRCAATAGSHAHLWGHVRPLSFRGCLQSGVWFLGTSLWCESSFWQHHGGFRRNWLWNASACIQWCCAACIRRHRSLWQQQCRNRCAPVVWHHALATLMRRMLEVPV